MELVTIRQYAENQRVSYEAVRKQVANYRDDLKGHIVRKGRTQYLDEKAVKFLTERRRENPVIVVSQDKDAEVEDLRQQLETLKVQLMAAQSELLKEKDRTINLMEEAKKGLEAKARYEALQSDNEEKGKKLEESERLRSDLQRQLEDRNSEISEIKRQRDEAQEAAQSYTPTLFGLFRKKRGK